MKKTYISTNQYSLWSSEEQGKITVGEEIQKKIEDIKSPFQSIKKNESIGAKLSRDNQKTIIFSDISAESQRQLSQSSKMLTSAYKAASNMNNYRASHLIRKIENILPPAVDCDNPFEDSLNVNPGRYFRMD